MSIEPLREWNLKRKYNISEINRKLEKYIFTLVLTPELLNNYLRQNNGVTKEKGAVQKKIIGSSPR